MHRLKNNTIINNENFRILAKNKQIIVGHVFENTYIILIES